MYQSHKLSIFLIFLVFAISNCIQSTNKQNSVTPSEVPKKDLGSLTINSSKKIASNSSERDADSKASSKDETPKFSLSDLKTIYFQPAPCTSGIKCAVAGLEVESSVRNYSSMKLALRYFIRGCYFRFIASCDAAILLIDKLYSKDRATLREHLNFTHQACLLRAVDSCFEAASMAEIRKETLKQKDYWNKACNKSLLKPNRDSREDFLNLINNISSYSGDFSQQSWRLDQSVCLS
ncbi:MAG: hypothetical protein KBD78_03090 [Oligoflexales bacterium]|nr:hypothetical protein [Oligoflexales bacterium]